MPGARTWCEAGLDGCAFALPPLLALVPRAAAPLAALGGLLAVGLATTRPDPSSRLAALRIPAAVFGLLLLWGGLSAIWAIDPARSLLIDARLAGLFAAGLALATAAGAVAAPWRLTLFLIAGTGLAIILAGCDLTTAGGLSQFVTTRNFIPPRLNQIAVWLAIMLLPVAALLVCRGRMPLAALAAAAMAAAVLLLDGTTAKTALALSLPVAVLLFFRRRLVARIVAIVLAAGILTAPLTFPHIADNPAVFEAADALKGSLGHRLLIWRFTGAHIDERPVLGWGLDSARAIPGGKDLIRPGQSWLPLHPHNAALQLWLELGAPGAILFALFLGWVWLRLATIEWPPLYAAAAGGSLTAATTASFAAWGVWQEWWLATLAIAAFLIVAMARAAAGPAIRPPPRGSPVSGR